MASFRTAIAVVSALLSIAILTGGAAGEERWMRTGSVTTQPIGHYDLCRRSAEECRQDTASARPVAMTRELWTRMIEVNDAFNTTILPRTDVEMWGVPEHWSYPAVEGDCEDFVLAKRKALMESGVPAGSLLITVVRQPNGDGHAVLTVRTSMGDFVLDNLEPRILRWFETEYQFVKRQSERHSGRWVRIDDARDMAVGSVRN
jgi:predicted transglutaminase-like cysteine proteinase